MKKLIALIFLFGYTVSYSQDLWENDFIKQQKIFTNLQQALQYPDSVFRLDLSRKRLKEFPPEILKLKQLRELNLSHNKLELLPETISMLPYLQFLYANNNKLVELPSSIGNLTLLQKLELNRNVIEKLPPEIGKLNNLEELSLWDNELGDVPDEVRNLGSLKIFELRGILFTDEQQRRIHELLPYTKLLFSPSCNCKQ